MCYFPVEALHIPAASPSLFAPRLIGPDSILKSRIMDDGRDSGDFPGF